MALQYPSIVPSGYTGDYQDFLRGKLDRSGAVRNVAGSVSIPGTTAGATVIGLFPFIKGFKLSYGSSFFFDDLDTSTNVTASVGYFYEDSTLTSVAAAFISASTAPQTGAIAVPNVKAGMTFVAAGNGWLVVTLGASATTTTGLVTFNANIAYDVGGLA